MNFPLHRKEGLLQQLPKAVAKYISRWPGRPIQPLRHSVYCGYLGDQTELEGRLWKLIQLSLSSQDEEQVLEHASSCAYCQSRIRDITGALHAAIPEESALVQTAAAPVAGLKLASLRMKLKKVKRVRVFEAGKELLADVLVALDTTGKWLCGQDGANMVLRYVPAWRGIGKSDARVAAKRFRSKRTFPSLKIGTEVEGLIISCEVQSVQNHLELSVQCRDVRGKRASGRSSIEYAIDGVPQTPTELDIDGTLAISLPLSVACADVTVYREGVQIGQVAIELEGNEA